MTTTTDSKYAVMHRVTFIGDYFNLTTCVLAHDEEHAIEVAQDFMKDHYGWQPDMWSNEIDVEREER